LNEYCYISVSECLSDITWLQKEVRIGDEIEGIVLKLNIVT